MKAKHTASWSLLAYYDLSPNLPGFRKINLPMHLVSSIGQNELSEFVEISRWVSRNSPNGSIINEEPDSP